MTQLELTTSFGTSFVESRFLNPVIAIALIVFTFLNQSERLAVCIRELIMFARSFLWYNGMKHSSMHINRRDWCISIAAWPQIAAALQEARAAAGTPKVQWRALDAVSARELETLTSIIIPSVGGPGAREAGVIHFIDQWVATFGVDELPGIQAGLAETERKRQQLFPESASMAELQPAQQMDLMRAIEHTDFFDLLRTLTILGFLGDPSYGGNRDRVGWNQIGFEPQMSYQHPFGYYDSETK